MSGTVELSAKDAAWLDDLVERGEHADRQTALDAVLRAQREAWVRETLGALLDEGLEGEASSLNLSDRADHILQETAPA